MALTLARLNAADVEQATAWLAGIYEHSPWIAGQALSKRPFASLAALKAAMADVVTQAGPDAQRQLIEAHPELAGRAMVSQTLTAESTNEQQKAGLTACSPQEFETLQALNASYRAKFGWPFILAVRGPRGTGLSRTEIIDTLGRRLHGHPDFEMQECLRNIHRIAEIRLKDLFGAETPDGDLVWDWHQSLARHSEPGFAARGQLSVTYLSDAHQACAREIAQGMRDCGFDHVSKDAVGNVVGRYRALGGAGKILLTGSHFDTVRNGGRYDGRLGIFVAMAAVRELHQQGKRLPFELEVVAFSEEEGQRYPATFLGSSALVGDFNPAWLEQRDSQGVSMRDAMHNAGLHVQDITQIKRDPSKYLGYVEIHIEQGPVLNELNRPLGVVSSINGSIRLQCEITGVPSHAGTTPMKRRRDAAAAVAELSVYMEQRAAQDDSLVATIGQWQVPDGSINVVPGRCLFSLDMRAPTDAQRDALAKDVLNQLQAIAERRGLSYRADEVMRAAAAPCNPIFQDDWAQCLARLGVPLTKLPSGAGHDAMKLHQIMPQAMLFVRGENAGISHNPLESTTSDDMQLAIDAFREFLVLQSERLA